MKIWNNIKTKKHMRVTRSFNETLFLWQVSISFAKILLQVTRPRTAILGKIPGTSVYRNIQQYTEASKVPGVMIVRVDSAIYFSNSNYVKERYIISSSFVYTLKQSNLNFFLRLKIVISCRILRWLTDEEAVKGDYHTRIQFLIVEMSR